MELKSAGVSGGRGGGSCCTICHTSASLRKGTLPWGQGASKSCKFANIRHGLGAESQPSTPSAKQLIGCIKGPLKCCQLIQTSYPPKTDPTSSPPLWALAGTQCPGICGGAVGLPRDQLGGHVCRSAQHSASRPNCSLKTFLFRPWRCTVCFDRFVDEARGQTQSKQCQCRQIHCAAACCIHQSLIH